MADSTADERAKVLVSSLASYWSLFTLRGLITFIFGLVFVCFPSTTIVVLASIFGAFAIIDGVVSLAKTIVVCRYAPQQKTFAAIHFTVFLLSMAIGISAIVFPKVTGKILLTIVAVWLLFIGVLELSLACLFQSFEPRAACIMCLGGLLYIIVGFIFLNDPGEGILIFTKLTGAILMVFGMQLMCVGRVLKSVNNKGVDTGINHLATESLV